ncbi:MAG: hypothetical protein H7A05_02385 [Pseudomonadales bacterium]|nr:hypothetical protein [Pseudomonadales bacterium]MCP5331562.1 hypothetical protein [Pseudomonadales bacterium]MCP5343445.1 hypothetical protein [Pseudomonadales bacterium]
MTLHAAHPLRFEILVPGQAGFSDACGKVAQLFARREAEFGFNPEIDHASVSIEAFLPAHASELPAAITGNEPLTILTTWSDRLAPILSKHGFAFRPIRWIAGPLNSGIFRREGTGPERYIELVNEEAPEIAPGHVLTVYDSCGFAGGAISTLRDNAAWLAVMCVRAGSSAGTGSRIWDVLVRDLAARGIGRLDLGTQTAERFYQRCGMKVSDRVLPNLRWRKGPGRNIWSDLVMMEIEL